MDIEEKLSRARTTHRHGDIDAAVPVYEEILAEAPDYPEALHLLGITNIQRGDPAKALELFEQAVSLAPDNTRIHNNLGIALLALQRVEEAAESFLKATKLDPQFVDAHFSLGVAYQQLRRDKRAALQYRKVLELSPGRRDALNNLASIFYTQHMYDKAEEIYREVVRLYPDAVEGVCGLAMTLEHLNQMDEAMELGSRLMTMEPDHPFVRLLRARLARRANQLTEARTTLEDLIASNLEPSLRYPALQELSLVLDRQRDFAGAFAANLESKKVRLAYPAIVDSKFDNAGRKIARVSAWCRSNKPLSHPADFREDIGAPVFFAGFPRSGTTLMEQILVSHPGLVTTDERSPLTRMIGQTSRAIGRSANFPDELNRLTVTEIGELRKLFVECAKKITGEDPIRKRLIDKNPLNILDLCIVNRLFPDARVLVALRDPRDVVLSCFMQNFGTIRVWLELEAISKFYRDTMNLWLQYRDWLTVPRLEYKYENLVSGFDGTVGEVLDFIGVPWDDSLRDYAAGARSRAIGTVSYAAVIEPINTRAVGRWRNYEKELAPILPILEPFVKEFGYEPS